MRGDDRPVAVFDSGLGGLSVLRALRRELPEERFLYFGDSANAPYGSRPAEEIFDLTLRHADTLFSRGAKALVVACNTATSIAIEALRSRYPEKIIIGIEPALKPAVERFPNGKILVLATETTLRERKFAELMDHFAATCEIFKCPCPELVGLVERGELSGPATESALKKRLGTYLGREIDAVVLGCTHFPFLRASISSFFGDKPMLFDGADGTAKETRRRLELENLLRRGDGEVTLTNSANDETQLRLAHKLLNTPIL